MNHITTIYFIISILLAIVNVSYFKSEKEQLIKVSKSYYRTGVIMVLIISFIPIFNILTTIDILSNIINNSKK